MLVGTPLYNMHKDVRWIPEEINSYKTDKMKGSVSKNRSAFILLVPDSNLLLSFYVEKHPDVLIREISCYNVLHEIKIHTFGWSEDQKQDFSTETQ